MNIIGDVSEVRRPYYRIRGKSITEEQAVEVIRRTDSLFREYSDYLSLVNCGNNIISGEYGWCHPNGLIGGNNTSNKYPELFEYIEEFLILTKEFPFLDMVLAISSWNEIPDEVRDKEIEYWYSWETEKEWDEKFLKAIEVGLYIHDGKLEVLSRADTVEKYKEYDSVCCDYRDMFIRDYYIDNNIKSVNKDFLRRCFEKYGLDVEKELLNKNIFNFVERQYWCEQFGISQR